MTNEETKPKITVGQLLADDRLGLSVRLVSGQSGLGRTIEHARIQKSGLAMVGHLHGLVPTRVQILGETELSFVESLDSEARKRAAKSFFSLQLACVLVTRGVEPPAEFLEQAELTSTPLAVCKQRSSVAIGALHTLLDERLAPRTRIHGVLVDVFEVGILLLGSSGIGKSEVALELVMRGHKLVADDVVECDYRPPGMLFAEPARLLRNHIEVRGLGILNIRDLFGVTAIRQRKRVDLVVRLETTQDDSQFDRLGQHDKHVELLGVSLRELVMPVRPGRNVSDLIEIAAREELMRRAGHDASREFLARVDLAAGLPPKNEPTDPGSSEPRHLSESSVPPPLSVAGPAAQPAAEPAGSSGPRRGPPHSSDESE
jgi:HPr kinase/phosphorylase